MCHSFAAIDFETANGKIHSICAVGVVTVDRNTVRERMWLVRPPGNRYARENTALHGLAAIDTTTARSFADVWPEAKEMIGNRTVIGHNMSWDAEALDAALAYYEKPAPLLRKGCSMDMAILVWPGRSDYKLPSLCSDLRIDLDNHNALSDARAVAELVKVMTAIEECALSELLKRSKKGAIRRREEARFRAMKGKPPTEKQLDLLATLLHEDGHSDPLITIIRNVMKAEWDRAEVSSAIDAVKSGKDITITRPNRKQLKALIGTRFSAISRGNRCGVVFTV